MEWRRGYSWLVGFLQCRVKPPSVQGKTYRILGSIRSAWRCMDCTGCVRYLVLAGMPVLVMCATESRGSHTTWMQTIRYSSAILCSSHNCAVKTESSVKSWTYAVHSHASVHSSIDDYAVHIVLSQADICSVEIEFQADSTSGK